MYWVLAIVAIGVLIVVHEAGHYFVARWCKMRVDKFSVGFGPAVWSRKNKHGTQFQLAPIPFGGYVQINGMLVAEEVDHDDPYSYPNRPAWQRFATIFAGPATNYLFAIVLAMILYSIAGVETGTSWYQVTGVQDGYDAQGKLLPGDELVGIKRYDADGNLTVEAPLYETYEGERQHGLVNHVQDAEQDTIYLEVERDGEKLPEPIPVNAKPIETDDGDTIYRLGISLMLQEERRDVGVATAVGHAFYYPIRQTEQIVTGLYDVIRGEQDGELTGPVGITTHIQRSIKAGWVTMLSLLMILNVYLGLFNLFPLPALDGGRLVFLGYEMATRRRANPKVEATVHMVGIMALLVIMVLVTYKDIANLL